MTLSDLLPGFQGHYIFLKSNVGKPARLKDKVTVAQEETINQSINRRNFSSAPYKTWAAALDNVII